jgi:hypothetical protein
MTPRKAPKRDARQKRNETLFAKTRRGTVGKSAAGHVRKAGQSLKEFMEGVQAQSWDRSPIGHVKGVRR